MHPAQLRSNYTFCVDGASTYIHSYIHDAMIVQLSSPCCFCSIMYLRRATCFYVDLPSQEGEEERREYRKEGEVCTFTKMTSAVVCPYLFVHVYSMTNVI